ncbi:MAG: ABC-type transport auxiliary lipoprotein family protein [Rickettsiales bacterium]
MKRMQYGAMLLLLAACTAAGAPDYYRLQPENITAATCKRAASIEVAQPSVAPGLDSAHIAVIDRPQHVSFYQDVAWTANLPAVLQSYFVDAMEQSHAFAGVMAEGDAGPAAYRLDIAVRNFEVDQSGQGRRLRVRFSAVLRQGGQAVLRKSLDAEEDVSAMNIEGIAQQFNRSLDGLTQQLLQTMQRKVRCGALPAQQPAA